MVEEAGRKCILLPGDLGKLSTIECAPSKTLATYKSTSAVVMTAGVRMGTGCSAMSSLWTLIVLA